MAATDTWEVFRRMEVMRQGESWETLSYDTLVWTCDKTNKVKATPVKVLPNYVEGLLRIKLNGTQTTLDAFVNKLTELHLTLADVMKAIKG